MDDISLFITPPLYISDETVLFFLKEASKRVVIVK